MAEFLVIRLRSAARTPPSWVVVNHDGARLSGVEKGPLGLAARRVDGRRVIALVPATEVLMTSANVPVRGGTKLIQALPFALEEQLAEDVDRLHFAPSNRTADGGIAAAVTSRADMDAWVERFAEAGIKPHALVPDAYALAPSPGGVSVLLDRDLVYLRREGNEPLVFQGMLLDQALELAGIGTDGSLPPASATRLTIFLGQRRHQGQSALWSDLRERFADVEIKLLPQGPLPHLAVHAARNPGINLLQGAYMPATSSAALWRPWRLAASLAAVCVVVAFGVKGVEYYQLSATEADLDALIAQEFQRALPNTPMSTDPRRQMERELKAALGGAAGDKPFLEILAVLGSVLVETPDARVDALSFRNDVMDLRLTVPSVGALDQIKRLVAERGRLETEIRSANPREDAIEGRLTLREPGA